jgi:hypothetical protein
MAPCFGICQDKARLREDFLDAVSRVGRLQLLQLRAVMGREEDIFLQRELSDARRKSTEAKDALLAHVRVHGCRD